MSDLHQCSQVLERGRQLAAAILSQLERFYLAVGNREEGKRLDLLQAEFLEWERQTHIQFPDLDTLAQFPDARLRPARKKIASQSEYLRLRNQWTIDELRAVPARLEQAKKAARVDCGGMWSGTIGI